MQFCDACDNTMTIALSTVDDDISIKHKCLACGTTRAVPEGCHLLFERYGTAATSNNHRQFVNDDIFVDPTVATLQARCPRCEADRDVRYIRFGAGLDFLYACTVCRAFWTRVRGGEAKIVKS